MLIVGFKSILAKYFRIQTPMKKLYWKLSAQGPCGNLILQRIVGLEFMELIILE